MADGGADDRPEEIGQASGTAGIYGITLCKTENFQGVFSTGKTVLPRFCGAVYLAVRVRDTPFLFLKNHKTEGYSGFCRCFKHRHYDGRPATANSQKLPFSAILKPVEPAGGRGMALEYTEEKLNSLDRETLIQLFLSQQEQLKQIDHNLQLVPEQMADLKRHRFGRSTEKHEMEDQLSLLWKRTGKSYSLMSQKPLWMRNP